MKTTQAWGWLIAGVVALGLNGIYQDGGAAWVNRAAGRVMNRVEERVAPVLAMATGRAGWFLARTNTVLAQQETSACRRATAAARAQRAFVRSDFGRFENYSARQEQAAAHLEERRALMEAQMAEMRFEPTVFEKTWSCPRVRVSVPQINVPQIYIPQVQVHVPSIDVNVGGPI